MAEPTHSKKNDADLVDMVHSENQAGSFLAVTDNLLMFVALWWLFSLRMRVEVRCCQNSLLRTGY
jgi:hypothetical protein